MKPQWKIIMLITALCITRILSAQQADRSAFRPASATNAGTTVKPDFRPAFLAYDYDDYDLAKHKRRKKHKGGGRGRDQAFGQGKFVITAGYGFPNLTKAVFKAYESNLGFKVSGFGPMHVKFDYGVTDKLSLGLSIRYLSYKVQWTDEESITTYDSLGNPNGTVSKDYTSGYKGSALGIMAHMNLHFATGAKIDPYWGIGIGYGNYNFKYFTDDPLSENISLKFPIPLAFESTVGIRYYFTDNIGAYLEAGWGSSLLQGGLAVKF